MTKMSMRERSIKRVQQKTDREVAGILAKRRASGKEVLSAHNESNLKDTADITQLIGRMYNFTPKELKLAYIAGSFHDIKRSPREGESSDERESAEIARETLEKFRRFTLRRGIEFWTNQKDRDAVYYAIVHHGKAPDFLTNDETRERVPINLPDRLHLVLFVADKMTANGYDILRRRPSHVAGERLHKPEGDLQKFGFQPNKDELLVVAMESAIRLAFVNPQVLYPRNLQHVVGPLYEIQRDFVKGVYKAVGITNRDLAELLLGIGKYAEIRWNGQSMAEYLSHKFKIPDDIGTDPTKLAAYLSDKTGITDEAIMLTSDEVVEGAKETVNYFSAHYQTDLDQLSNTWEPESSVAKQWKKGMDEYTNGTWFEKMMATI